MWFNRKLKLDRKRIEIETQKFGEYIASLSEAESEKIFYSKKLIPRKIKNKLYDFLVEFNELDACLDQFYRVNHGFVRDISSNRKPIRSCLIQLFNDKKLEGLLKAIGEFTDEEVAKKLVTVKESIDIRDRIAHAIPIWDSRYSDFIIFTSYDGVFWNKFYNKMRQEKSDFYQTQYFKEQLNKKILSENCFAYVIYPLSVIEYRMGLMIQLKNIIGDQFRVKFNQI
ncbi:hypothetical protein G9F32_10505 [Acinetobacter sp. 194]|uniref:hypothetical protein n=1 Tax=Acinetobacter shaoyimingii TaxID=2715164 RepID=UPI00140E194D|nr:hypothetical protein [Acinetobacter shaoyimingii]NHB58441.1 hypothetical protein [Acinetobacter shaoyimingii]